MLPSVLSKIHPKYQTPYYAIMVQTILTILIVLSGSYKLLLEMVLPLAIFMYSIVIVTVTVLRFTKKNYPRTFKIPFGKILPIVTACLLLFLAGGIELHTTILGLMFIFLGIPFFLIEAMLYRPNTVKKLLSFSVGVSAKTTDIWIKPKTRKYIIQHLGNLRGKKIMNFGTDVSNFTMELSQLIGEKGKLYVTHLSKDHLDATRDLADEKGAKNIKYYLESEQRHKLHEDLKSFDAVVSIGVLGYIEDPHKVIKEIGKRVKKGAKIYFIDYTNVLHIMPEQKWMKEPKRVKEIFQKAGFKVHVGKERGKLWDVLHIYGEKI